MSIEESNKLIAAFMGFFQDNHKEINNSDDSLQWMCVNVNCCYDMDHDDFPYLERTYYYKFDSSWDWLMPVITKIASLKKADKYIYFNIEVIALPIYTPIEKVYERVIEFIQWFPNK